MSTRQQIPLVYVVDDDFEIRTALSVLLKQEKMDVETFASGEEFLDAILPKTGARITKPMSCAILDVMLPGLNGLDLQEILSAKNVHLPIIFLSGHGDIPMSVEAIKGGAENFLTKPVSREKLMSNVRIALQKGTELHTQRQLKEAAKLRLQNLTARELEILAMTIDGSPNKLIANRLGISLRTVEHHKTNILSKTETTNSYELARLVQESNLEVS